jgi:hypothetical protein
MSGTVPSSGSPPRVSFCRLVLNWIKDKLASWLFLPLTPRTRRQHLREIIDFAHLTRHTFSALKSLPADRKAQISRPVRHRLNQLDGAWGYSEALFHVLCSPAPPVVASVWAFVGLISTGLVAWRYLHLEPTGRYTLFFTLFIVSALLSFFSVIRLLLWLWRLERRDDPLKFVNPVIYACILLLLGGFWTVSQYLYLHPLLPNSIKHVALSGATTGVALAAVGVLLAVLLFAGVIVVLAGLQRLTERLYPEALIVKNLIQALHMLEESPGRGRLPMPRFSLELVETIQAAARPFEHDFARKYRPADARLRVWFADRSTEIGAALLDTARLALTPSAGSSEALRSTLAEALFLAASGLWGDLPRKTPEKIPRRALLLRLLQLSRFSLIAIAPLVVVFIAQRFAILTADPVGGYLRTGAVLWGVAVLLDALDPTGKKLAIMKELLPGAGERGH